MQYNNKFGMQDLFMNKELKNLFPQFSKKDGLKNVYTFEWVEKKVADYIKSVFGGKKSGDEIIIPGKFKDKFKAIKNMKGLIEDMFNNIPAITKNVRKNTKLLTPFQSIDQLKSIQEPDKKIKVMQIVFDNLNYNPDFESENRFGNVKIKSKDFAKRQEKWMEMVGYNNKRR